MTTLDEMWTRLVQHQPYADANGYGLAWAEMCEQRTAKAAGAAGDAAWADAAWDAEWVVGDAAWAAWNARAATWGADAAVRATAIRCIERAERIYDKEDAK